MAAQHGGRVVSLLCGRFGCASTPQRKLSVAGEGYEGLSHLGWEKIRPLVWGCSEPPARNDIYLKNAVTQRSYCLCFQLPLAFVELSSRSSKKFRRGRPPGPKADAKQHSPLPGRCNDSLEDKSTQPFEN